MNNNIDRKMSDLIEIVPYNLKKTVVNYQMCQKNLMFSTYIVLITIFFKLSMGIGFNNEWFIQVVSIVVGLLILFMMVSKQIYQYKLKEYLKILNIKRFEIFDMMLLLSVVLLLVDTIVGLLLI